MKEVVSAMLATIVHRGPDGDGFWGDTAGRCALGHRRLAIIDTSPAGRQPRATGDARWCITFNGELYNFQEIRPALEAAGVHLRSRTDTEVLIESIALWGNDAFPKLDGQFALAAFDTQRSELLLARDPFGEKPLYYMEFGDGGLAFASELQALECVPGFDGTVSLDAMAEVLSFQYIGAPRSIYQNVKKLPPGHWLRMDAEGHITIGRFFQFEPGSHGSSHRRLPDLVDELEDILVRSIRRRMISDVPLGAFLSGGVDSSTVCALIRRKLDRPLMTFSIGFKDAAESEHLTAQMFAKHLGTDHYDQVLGPDTADFLLNIGAKLDEPNADSSCLPTYLLSGFARQHVTVALSGDGGDEMFGGYGRYFATLEEFANHRVSGRAGWTPGSVYYGYRILVATEPDIEALFGSVPPGFAAHLGRLRAELNAAEHDLLRAMRRTDTDNYMPGAVLPKVDRMSMRHSLEVRTPFLNAELARFAERLPDSILVKHGRGKIILRELAYRYLPRELVDLPKQGFGLPMSDWARTSLLDVTGKLIEDDDSRLRAAFGQAAIQRFMKRQSTPGHFSAYQVWAVAMLESWFRHHPAKLPSVGEEPRAGAARRSQPAEADPVPLNIIPFAEGKYLVMGGTDRQAFGPVFDGLKQYLPAGDALDALAVLLSDNTESIAEHSIMQLPAWGQPLSPDDLARLAPLRGSTLLFAAPDAWSHFDFGEFLKFRVLGVRCVMLQDPSAEQEYQLFELRSPALGQHIGNLAKLFRKRIGLVSNARWMLGATRFNASPDGCNSTRAIKTIDPVPETELCDSVMFFEGGRQLPPLRMPHSEIGPKGKGRYSIWNQSVFFSATDATRRDTRPYWVVPLNEATEPLLQIVPKPRCRRTIACTGDQSSLANTAAPALDLRVGDPVVVCTHALPPGGAERQWVYLAQALADAGYKVTFVTYEQLDDSNVHYLSMLTSRNIPVMDVSGVSITEQIRNWPRTPEAMRVLGSGIIPQLDRLMKLTAAFRAIRPKAVFAQLDHPNVLAGFAGYFADVPRIVLSFRNYNPTHFDYINQDWYLPAYRALAKLARVQFSGNNRSANADYADWIGIPHDRVAYVPNAIEPAAFLPPSNEELAHGRAELGVGPDTPVILGAFRLSPEKDPLTFIDVCARVARSIPTMRAFLVGVGPMRDQVEGRIAALGVGGQITLLGRRSDMNVMMSLARVFLLTSVKEGMPNVLMEAQLMGTPVVATRSGGAPDVMIEGVTGILRDVGDVEGLAGACLELLDDAAKARRMGEAGRAHVTASFPKAQIARRYVDLLLGSAAECDNEATGRPAAVSAA